jgi:hypothetical protein
VGCAEFHLLLRQFFVAVMYIFSLHLLAYVSENLHGKRLLFVIVNLCTGGSGAVSSPSPLYLSFLWQLCTFSLSVSFSAYISRTSSL